LEPPLAWPSGRTNCHNYKRSLRLHAEDQARGSARIAAHIISYVNM